jgi:hypothetical protein
MATYNDRLAVNRQIHAEEDIASAIFSFQEGQIALDDANNCDDHTLTEEDCAELGRGLLMLVLSQFRPDLVEKSRRVVS